MKYRFRVSSKPIVPSEEPRLPARRRRFRLKGSDTLRPLSRLPEPVEEILFEFGDLGDPFEKEKKSRRQKKKRAPRLRPLLRPIGVALSAGISLLWHKTKRLFLRRTPPRARSIHALPVLSGALCATLLVSALSAGCVLLGLFARYGRSYESVTVPDFVGKTPESVLADDDRFDLIIQYEKNDLVAEGLVITQAPHAGVRRRIYAPDNACTVVLTVSEPREHYTLEELVGQSKRDATLALRNAGILPSVREEYSDTVAKGTVISTLPPSGTTLAEGDTVILRVSLGKQILLSTVPALFGVTEARANALLRAASLEAGSVTYRSSSLPAGTVIAQDVAAGSSVEGGSRISYTVSAGDRYLMRTVPDLYGMPLTEAAEKLKEYGLVLGNIYPVGGSSAKGTVMTQSPLPGAPITSATVTVDVYVTS